MYQHSRVQAMWEYTFKGTVSVISSDPPYKDGNGRFTTASP